MPRDERRASLSPESTDGETTISRYIEIAHQPFRANIVVPPPLSEPPAAFFEPPKATAAGRSFVVKLRDTDARAWGDQTEILADCAKDAAEMMAGQHLSNHGVRDDLRARVWQTPFGSKPDEAFYLQASSPSS